MKVIIEPSSTQNEIRHKSPIKTTIYNSQHFFLHSFASSTKSFSLHLNNGIKPDAYMNPSRVNSFQCSKCVAFWHILLHGILETIAFMWTEICFSLSCIWTRNKTAFLNEKRETCIQILRRSITGIEMLIFSYNLWTSQPYVCKMFVTYSHSNIHRVV